MLLLGLGLLIAGIVASFWKEIVSWVNRAAKLVLQKIGRAVIGVKIFVRKISEAIKEISKHYTQDAAGKWKETIVSREISESEVPKDILKKAERSSSDVDITDDVERQLVRA